MPEKLSQTKCVVLYPDEPTIIMLFINKFVWCNFRLAFRYLSLCALVCANWKWENRYFSAGQPSIERKKILLGIVERIVLAFLFVLHCSRISITFGCCNVCSSAMSRSPALTAPFIYCSNRKKSELLKLEFSMEFIEYLRTMIIRETEIFPIKLCLSAFG